MTSCKKIYYIEDDGNLSELMKTQLEKLGYEVCGSAQTAPAGIAGIQKCNPDLVLVDIELQGKPDGLAIGNYLISKTDIPFIYVTAHDENQMLAQARQTIPDGFLLKPFDMRQLKVAIEMANRVD
jgi:DNA-binding response OmpR family regulator